MAREIYQDRAKCAKNLRERGKKVVGFLCIYPPLEIMTALGLSPYRVFGDMKEQITHADAYLPARVCPFIRSLLDCGLKGKYDFLDGIVMSHSCDAAMCVGPIWRARIKTAHSHYLDVPHGTRPLARQRFKETLVDYLRFCEEVAGKELSSANLTDAIRMHNEQRMLVRELYDLRKPNPPLLSGLETLQVMIALSSLPVEEGNRLIREVIGEVKRRPDGATKKAPRLLIWGSIIDDISLIEIIENAGAHIVMDDTCVGSRAFFPDVEITDDPLDGIVDRYLFDLKCPRTFREDTGNGFVADLKDRFNYLADYARDWKVEGVILQTVTYCDTHCYEVPALKSYLKSIGLPNIYIDHDYSGSGLGQTSTRIQAFLEMIDP